MLRDLCLKTFEEKNTHENRESQNKHGDQRVLKSAMSGNQITSEASPQTAKTCCCVSVFE